MTRRRWLLAALVGILTAAALSWFLVRMRTAGPASAPAERAAAGEPSRGGSLVGTLRTEPKTFNRYTSSGFPTHLIAALTQARLVRIAREQPLRRERIHEQRKQPE